MGVKLQLVVFLLIFVFVALKIHALKCLQNDTNNDEMKKVVRTCMKRYENNNVGGNENNNANDYDDNNSEDNEPFRVRNRDTLQMRTGRNRRSPYDRNRQQQNEKRYNTFNNQRNYQNNTDINKNRENRFKQNDRSCMVHCFFEELSMLNKDDFPDKHKVLHVITRDIRDTDLKELYIDSIQECFHFTEMEQRRDKCLFSKSLITCMAEYAKANCEDWHDHTMIFN